MLCNDWSNVTLSVLSAILSSMVDVTLYWPLLDRHSADRKESRERERGTQAAKGGGSDSNLRLLHMVACSPLS